MFKIGLAYKECEYIYVNIVLMRSTHNDIQQNGIRQNDIQYNYNHQNDIQRIQQNENQKNDIQHNDTQHNNILTLPHSTIVTITL